VARHALLIATGRYTDQLFRRLRSPVQDVKRLAEVLRDPAIGCFDNVRVCVDEPEHKLRVAVEDILSDRHRDDLILLYVSCHGVQDRRGRLYFATTNTRLDRLAATALSAAFVDEQLSNSIAGGRVLILDCCFSGSFAHGLAVKSSFSSPLAGKVGRGYFVLTATDAFEYAFEGESSRGIRPRLSICTEAIVAGLQSGLADRDGDGWVSAHDLYEHVYDVVKQAAMQTPTYFASNVEGRLLLARVPQTAQPSTAHGVVTPPVQGKVAAAGTGWRLSLPARWRVAVLAILLLSAMAVHTAPHRKQAPAHHQKTDSERQSP
jgi:chaperonin GroEL